MGYVHKIERRPTAPNNRLARRACADNALEADFNNRHRDKTAAVEPRNSAVCPRYECAGLTEARDQLALGSSRASGVVRAWVSYGPRGAAALLVAFVPMVALLRRWGRKGSEPDTWLLLALLFGVGAIALFLTAPFAHTSNVGVDVADSRSTTIQAAVACAVLAPLCWAIAHVRAARRDNRGNSR